MKQNTDKVTLWKYAKLHNKFLVLTCLFTILIIVVQLVSPQITRYFIDQSSKGNVGRELYLAAIAYVLMALLVQLFNIVLSYFSQNFAWKATNALRIDLR